MHTLGYLLLGYRWIVTLYYDDHMCSLGLVMGLDYANPSLDAHAELQRLKHHPHMRPYFQDAKRMGFASKRSTGRLSALRPVIFLGDDHWLRGGFCQRWQNQRHAYGDDVWSGCDGGGVY